MGTLYLVSTPIGNLEDMTLRGLRVLREAHLIAAEDTRQTRKLLARYDIATPCISYHEHNKLSRLDDVLTALAAGDVALVSDAGTPALSDPGLELVQTCIAAGLPVSPIPGANAPVAALVASGLPTDRFYYLGFLPRRSTERRALFERLIELPATLVCFESPHRLVAALTDALEVLGDRQIVVARELTKLHEELLRVRISEAREHFRAQQRPRGEFTLVIAGAAQDRHAGPPPQAAEAGQTSSSLPPLLDEAEETNEAAITAHLRRLRSQGQRGSSAVRAVARELGIPRRIVYQVWLTLAEDLPADEA